MFVGHFAGGFGLKHAAPAISLGKLAVITWALLIGGAYRDLASTRRAW